MNAEVIKLLEAMEAELKALECWKEVPPSAEAITSDVPFCMDTMPFSQWLQWLFIPRVRAIVDHGAALPKGANMKPYAEEALLVEGLVVEGVSAKKLLAIVEQFDELMN